MGKWFRICAAVAATLVATGGMVSAQSAFPSKPVHIFVPYAPGGGVDVPARTLGDVVSRQWGQTVVVENRPGAGGLIASQALVASPPDGYTLIVVASGHATNPFLYPKIPYDTFKDFAPISLLASSPNILLVRTAPAINDLLGGQIPMSLNNGPESVGQLEAGTLRALAVTTASRASFLPNVPSMAETVPGYDTEVWWGLLGPAGMPRDLIEKLSHDFVAALNTDSVKQRLTKLGATPIGSSPQQFDAKIRADYEKWGPIIKAAGIKAE